MPHADLPAFADLRRRFSSQDAQEPDDTAVVPFAQALAAGDDPRHVLSYLRGLGVAVASPEDLHAGIAGLADEEELAAFRCREGVAVVVASQDAWVLFTDDAP